MGCLRHRLHYVLQKERLPARSALGVSGLVRNARRDRMYGYAQVRFQRSGSSYSTDPVGGGTANGLDNPVQALLSTDPCRWKIVEG
jgi:hypothetical protein